MVVNVCCKTLQRVYIGAEITRHTFRRIKLRRIVSVTGTKECNI